MDKNEDKDVTGPENSIKSYTVPCRSCGDLQVVESVLCGLCTEKEETGPDDVMDLRLFLEPMSPVFGNEFGIWIIGRDQRSRKRLHCRVVFEGEAEEGDSLSENFRLKSSDIQGIMDRLWSAGVRPSSGEGNEGALSATKDHLNDMREIAFKKLAAPNLVVIDGKIAEVCPKEQAGAGKVDLSK